jgi:hypothetical protein
MFGSFLLDQGVEMELDAELGEVLSALDREVPSFACDGYGFRLNVVKGVLGSQWRLLVTAVEEDSGEALDSPIGLAIVSREDDGSTSFRIPPRSEWSESHPEVSDADGRLFTSFVLQLFEAFHRLGWMELPGPLPER